MAKALAPLSQKLNHPKHETPEYKKERLAKEHKAARGKPFEEKESYRWVEAIQAVENHFEAAQKKLKATGEQLQEAFSCYQSFNSHYSHF